MADMSSEVGKNVWWAGACAWWAGACASLAGAWCPAFPVGCDGSARRIWALRRSPGQRWKGVPEATADAMWPGGTMPDTRT